MSGSAHWHDGACHCGGVKFRVHIRDDQMVVRCNCSICAMKGIVMRTVQLEDFELLEGEDLLTLYQYNTREAKHWFCSRCGIYTHHQRRSFPDQFAVNVACLEGVSPYDFGELSVIDGQNHPKDTGRPWETAGTLLYVPSGARKPE